MITKQLRIDEQILNGDKVICRHIANLDSMTRGQVSQDILSQLRHFVEHIMLKVYAADKDIEDSQENLKQAVKKVKSTPSLSFLSRFHHFYRYLFHTALWEKKILSD